MIEALEDSIMHFFNEILEVEISPASRIGGELYGAAIPIFWAKKAEYHFYLFFPKKIIQKIANTWLAKPLGEDDLNDFLKELANQIIGQAKNSINKERHTDEYRLGIPEYLGKVEHFSQIKLKKKLTYRLYDRCFRIGYTKA